MMKRFIATVFFLLALVLTAQAQTLLNPYLYATGGGGGCSIALDNFDDTAAQSSPSSFTEAFTVSGTNRLLLVTVSRFPSANTISSLTYNGDALTKLDTQIDADDQAVEIWYLVNPDTGTNNIVGNLTAGTEIVLGFTSWTCVNQSTPLGTQAKAAGSGTTPSVNVSSASGELVIDAVETFGGTLSVGAGQTQRINRNDGAGFLLGTSTEAGAGTVTMSWTKSASSSWAIIGVPIKPAP